MNPIAIPINHKVSVDIIKPFIEKKCRYYNFHCFIIIIIILITIIQVTRCNPNIKPRITKMKKTWAYKK